LAATKSRSRPEIAPHGDASRLPGAGPGRGHKAEEKQADNISLLLESKHGDRTDYLTDRLRTQHPDIFERLEQGKFKSVRQAAIEAGIRPKMVQHVATVEGYMRSIKKHLSPEDRSRLTRLLSDENG
jgi:hypothetical protein